MGYRVFVWQRRLQMERGEKGEITGRVLKGRALVAVSGRMAQVDGHPKDLDWTPGIPSLKRPTANSWRDAHIRPGWGKVLDEDEADIRLGPPPPDGEEEDQELLNVSPWLFPSEREQPGQAARRKTRVNVKKDARAIRETYTEEQLRELLRELQDDDSRLPRD